MFDGVIAEVHPDPFAPPIANYEHTRAAATASAQDMVDRAKYAAESVSREPYTDRETFLIERLQQYLIAAEERAMVYQQEYEAKWLPKCDEEKCDFPF